MKGTKMTREKLPNNYYFFAAVHYKDGRVQTWRFSTRTLRRSAIVAFNRDDNVKKVIESEGLG